MPAHLHGPATFIAIIVSGLSLVIGLRLYSQIDDSGVLKPDQFHLFKDVTGPQQRSTLAKPIAASLDRYADGAASRLAILLTDEQSNWLGLAHGLKSIGVPFLITRDYKKALMHRVIFVYPSISGSSFDPEGLRALAAVPRNGGTLIATTDIRGGLEEVFGFSDVKSSRRNREIRWNREHPLMAAMMDPGEQATKLGDPDAESDAIGSYGYIKAGSALARYPDGLAAVASKDYAGGHAYAIGLDLGALILKAYNNRADGMTRSFDNRFDPTIDVWLRAIKTMYQAGEPAAVTAGTVPFDKSLSVIFTHDIDFTQSMVNAVKYAEYEKSRGIVGTYFVQAKYIKDYNDDIFFNDEGVRHLRQLADLGMELGSHTVAHSKVFNKFPMGTGSEQYPDYRPFVKDRTTATGGSILGELRVSKFLVEHFGGQMPMTSFRPGELSNPFNLPEALVATGYRYSSSATANDSLTHLPFQLTYGRATESEVDIFEFPVTVEDEELPPMGERVQEAVELAKKIARYGGSVVVLIHPNILGHKLQFEQDFVDAVDEFSWFGSVRQFGDWWSARNAVQIDAERKGAQLVVTVRAPMPLAGLVLDIPDGWKLAGGRSDSFSAVQTGRSVLISEAAGSMTLRFGQRRTNPGH